MKVSEGDAVNPVVEISWYRSLPWWRFLSRSIAISWRATHLLACVFGIFMTQLGWDLGQWVFQPTDIGVSAWSDRPVTHLLSDASFAPMRPDVSNSPIPAPTLNQPLRLYNGSTGGSPVVDAWWRYVSPLAGLLTSKTVNHFAFWVFQFLWMAAVWTLIGGIIARRSVVELGTQTAVGWTDSVRLVLARWTSLMWAMAMPLIGSILLAIIPLCLGLIGRLGSLGQLLAGLGMLPAFLLSIGIGWSAAVALFGFSIMVVAIVTERKADAFDGFSRTAAYLFQRPMTLGLALVIGSFAGWVAEAIAGTILAFGAQAIWFAFEVGSGQTRTEWIGHAGTDAKLLSWGSSLIDALIHAIRFSFFWTASAAVYLTLRYEVDETDMDDLDVGDHPPAKALPPLDKTDIAEESITPSDAT